jgi:hypothetical protein
MPVSLCPCVTLDLCDGAPCAVLCCAVYPVLCCAPLCQVAGERIGSSVTGMLAVQVAGATLGNMICINNILSAKAVMNMAHVPGAGFGGMGSAVLVGRGVEGGGGWGGGC